MSFRDRTEAGKKLAEALSAYKGRKAAVFALPRGGVPVAAEVADALDAPLDLVVVRKVGVPSQPELAMGAVADGEEPIVVRNEDVIGMIGIADSEFEQSAQSELAEVERRRTTYLGERPKVDVAGRVAIVVDDGIATGATTRAAVRALKRRGPDKVVLAVPVGPTDTVEEMRAEADEVVCLEEHVAFGAIGYFYSDFSQLTDRDVIDILNRLGAREEPGG